ncbi:MAG: hypothetical protein ACYCPN_00390 [Thermoplasmata archaeon]
MTESEIHRSDRAEAGSPTRATRSFTPRTGDRAPARTLPNSGKLVVRNQGVEVFSLDLDRRRARVDLAIGGATEDPGLPLPELPFRRVFALASLLDQRGWTLELDRHAHELFTLGREAPAWSGHVGLHIRGLIEWLHPISPKARNP